MQVNEEKTKKTMSVNEFAKEVHEVAVQHGWWDREVSFPEVIALCHSELSEALEDWRAGREEADWKNQKPAGVPFELADVILRVLDYCGAKGIDIEKMLEEKHEFNKSRPYKHGGKKI